MLRRSKRELPVDAFVDQVAWTGPDARRPGCCTPSGTAPWTPRSPQLPTRRRELVNAIFRVPPIRLRPGLPVDRDAVGSIGPTRGRALVELRGRMQRGGYGPEDLVAMTSTERRGR